MARVRRRDLGLEGRWRKIVEGQPRSGMSVSGYCSSLGVSVASFYYWKRELHRRRQEDGSKGAAFVPVQVVGMAREPIEMELAGAIVRVPTHFDEDALARVIRALRATSAEES